VPSGVPWAAPASRSLSIIECCHSNQRTRHEESIHRIDAHKESNLFASAFDGREEAKIIGKVSADLNRSVDALRKFQKKHGLEKKQLHICYEAGPTGFVLARRLIKLG